VRAPHGCADGVLPEAPHSGVLQPPCAQPVGAPLELSDILVAAADGEEDHSAAASRSSGSGDSAAAALHTLSAAADAVVLRNAAVSTSGKARVQEQTTKGAARCRCTACLRCSVM
jgi:hypothetical protein